MKLAIRLFAAGLLWAASTGVSSPASAAGAPKKGSADRREGFAATRGGVRIHYLESGPANVSTALVLIPGWRLPASLWGGELERFGAAWRVLAVDPRSQGPSTKASSGNTPEVRAEDLHDVLSRLGITRCVLVGWSQGAQDVAAYLAEYGSSSVDGIVLVDSPVSAGPAEIALHREFSEVILSGISTFARHPAEYSEGMVRSIFAKPHPEIDVPALVRTTMETPVDTAIAMLVADIFGADRRPALAKLDKPALVVASAKSPLLDAQKEMAAAIPGSRFVVVKETGHAVFVDAPEEFDDALRAFLESVYP